MTLKTLEHRDVRGNKLYYLVITNVKGTEYMINVGEKTCTKIKELNEEEENYYLNGENEEQPFK